MEIEQFCHDDDVCRSIYPVRCMLYNSCRYIIVLSIPVSLMLSCFTHFQHTVRPRLHVIRLGCFIFDCISPTCWQLVGTIIVHMWSSQQAADPDSLRSPPGHIPTSEGFKASKLFVGLTFQGQNLENVPGELGTLELCLADSAGFPSWAVQVAPSSVGLRNLQSTTYSPGGI